MEAAMLLVIDRMGCVRCLYSETLDLHRLGQLTIARASHVEPDHQGQWWADLAPVRGPKLGPFEHRSEALAAEERWLSTWLTEPSHSSSTAIHQKGTTMNQSDLDHEVARATGESVSVIKRIGFSLLRIPPAYPVSTGGDVAVPSTQDQTSQHLHDARS
jgi:hypothetical protein